MTIIKEGDLRRLNEAEAVGGDAVILLTEDGLFQSTATGTVIVNGATPVTVADTRIKAESIVVFSINTLGGTQGAIPVVDGGSVLAGISFDVIATAGDTSTYNYRIL